MSHVRDDFRRYYQLMQGGGTVRYLQSLRQPGLQATAVYRFGRWILSRPGWQRLLLGPVYLILDFLVQAVWGIEISRHANIGPGLYVGHFGGITISPDAVIGSNCNLSQNTTIGLSGGAGSAGVPVIGNDVYIAMGARLFGRIRVGNNVKIGANAVIYRDILDNAVVVTGDFKVISLKGNRPQPEQGVPVRTSTPTGPGHAAGPDYPAESRGDAARRDEIEMPG